MIVSSHPCDLLHRTGEIEEERKERTISVFLWDLVKVNLSRGTPLKLDILRSFQAWYNFIISSFQALLVTGGA